jgi:hypothetical protein
MPFPANFPADCPLAHAADCNGAVFMAFKHLPISANQCLTQAERGRAANVQGADLCKRHGLSVFPSVDACKHQIELFPRIGTHVGHALLDPTHGLLAATPTQNPGHMTWWVFEGVERHALFNVVEER